MATRTPASGYSSVAIALHWTIALLILANAAGGLLADSVDDATARTIMNIHKPTGITILALSLVRLGWRVTHGFPPLPPSTPRWDAVFARATHVAFYALMIAIPLTGWTLVSGGSRPLEYFGLFDIPKLPVSRATSEAAGEVHGLFAFLMLGLAALHVLGALKHHLIDRDEVLARMLPLVRRGRDRR
jgi:cytochrome b561